jgi:2-methylcitrate dehydratase PrpD
LRIGEAVNPSHYRYWHPTGTAATFGAAVAAGSLLQLTSAQMLHALGSAGTQAAGLWEFNADGAMSKALHPGKAALNGVLAADLAKLGFTGATRILEGARGFFRAMSSAHDPTRLTDGLGKHWKISETCYKLYACCGHTHTAIDTALDLRTELGWQSDEALTNVAALHIETYGPGYDIVKEMNPRTPYQAKFSLAYVTAVALLEGWVGLEQFSPERFGVDGVVEPQVAALLPRIQITVNDGLSARYPAAWPAHLALTLTNGTVVAEGSDYPRGNPENPVTTVGLEEKLRSLVTPRYDAALAERAIAFVQALEQIADISTAVRRLLNGKD